MVISQEREIVLELNGMVPPTSLGPTSPVRREYEFKTGSVVEVIKANLAPEKKTGRPLAIWCAARNIKTGARP